MGKRLRRRATTMSTMVNDLLEYSRTQLGWQDAICRMLLCGPPAAMSSELAKHTYLH